MSTQRLKLEVLLAAINKATAPLKQISKGSTETAKALKAARDRLRELNDQQKNLDGFRKLDKDLAINANAMKGAQQRVKELKLAMDGVEKPTAAMSREFSKAVKEARGLKNQHTDLISKQQQLRTQLNGSGMDTQQLATHQRKLKADMAEATKTVEQQTLALKKQAEIAARMNQAKRAMDEGMRRRNQIASFGAQSVATGVAIGAPVLKAAKDFKEFESAMVGVAKQVEGTRDANGQLTATYYEMSDAIKDMAERQPLTPVEIARLVEGAARMGIQGKQNLLIFTEQAAIMASAFDLQVDQIAEDMGMMANLYKIPIDRIHEMGDAINWLDDNAQSQGGDIIAVMKRIAGTADMVGMSYKDAAALGSTFLSLGSTSEVAATASNAMISRLTNAPILSTAKRYAAGLKMLNLEAKDLQKNMNLDATGTILMVLDRIKALPKDQQLEAATRLFGVEYGDDASKLAQNLEEYRRQLKLTQEADAGGSMLREARARNESLDAQLEMTKSAIFSSSSELGQQLKPALVDILQIIKAVTRAVRDWVKENPVLAGYIIKTIAAVSILTIGVGGLALAIAAIMGPMILMRYGLALLGIKGGGLLTVVRGLGIAGLKLGAAFTVGYAAGTVLAKGIDIWLSKVLGFKTSLGGLVYDIVQAFKAGDWPSIGSFIILGIELGLDQATRGLYSKIKGIVKRIPAMMTGRDNSVMAGYGTNDTGAVMPRSVAVRATPPLRRTGGSVTHNTNQPTIHVHAAPGMDEQQLSKLVAKEIENDKHSWMARNRSSMRDRD